nr:PREDICTED: sorting nexin-29-like [Latimeria chalumnae]|eukprot:XP_014339661.1 PREDICTED: sorting nexin-29-like [Latimeria chalumnae]
MAHLIIWFVETNMKVLFLLWTLLRKDQSFSTGELRQAIVAMMNRKDELEEENRSLRNLLDGEMEHSAALRQEIDNLKKKVAEQEERHTVKIQALARENEVLKVQLKKYVGAVQMLKREGGQANDGKIRCINCG